MKILKNAGGLGLGMLQADSLENAYNQSQDLRPKPRGLASADGTLRLRENPPGRGHCQPPRSKPMSLPLFLTVPDLLDWLRFAYGGSEMSFEDRFEEIREIPLLILDDFGTQNATAWAQEKIFQIINHRYVNQLPTVITSNILIDDF